MTETTEPGGDLPAQDTPALPDRLPTDGQSIIAQRTLAAPTSVDRATRSVDVVWSTGARARNFVPSLGGITEELDMSPNAVRMAQLRSGNAPVLNTHRSADARDVLGRVIAARLEGGRGHARLQFSTAADVEPLWQRIADGTLRAVSIGYRVHRYDQRPDPASGEMIYRAVDFDATAWAFAEADLPGIVGFHQGATATTTLAAAEQILAGSSAILAAGRGGKLRLADPLASDAPQFDLPAECVLACEPLPLPASLRPLPRAIAVRWGLNHAPLSNMAGSVAAADRQRLSQAGSFARAESSLITSRVAQQREMTFPAAYWTEAEALARAEKWRALLEAGPRMLRVVTDRYLGQVEIGQIWRVTYPAFGFQNGFVGVVVGWRERLSARRVEITLWGAG